MLDVRIVVTPGRGQCPGGSVGVLFFDNGDWNSSVGENSSKCVCPAVALSTCVLSFKDRVTNKKGHDHVSLSLYHRVECALWVSYH